MHADAESAGDHVPWFLHHHVMGKQGWIIGRLQCGIRPDSPSSHCARTCKMNMGKSADADAPCSLEILWHHKVGLSRALHESIVMAPRELLANDIAGHAGLRAQLMDAIESNALSPS